MSSPGHYAKGFVRLTAGGKRVMWDGNRWQQLCQIDQCLKRDQKSQGVCLIHYREQLETQLNSPTKKLKVSTPEKKSSQKPSTIESKKSKRSKSTRATNDGNPSEVERKASTSLTLNSSKSRRSSRKLNLVCSSLTRQQLSQMELFCTRFAARLSPQIDANTTHLIASEVEHRVCCLTKKVFFAVAFHHYVVSYQWIEDCLEKQSLLNEENYEILGDSSLSSDHNGMHRSRLTRQPIFKSYPYGIAVECAVGCQQGMFTRDELEQLVELSGAKLIRNLRDEENPLESNRTIVVLCDDDDQTVRKKYQHLKNNLVFVIPEFFLDSIVLYEVQPIKCYELIDQNDG